MLAGATAPAAGATAGNQLAARVPAGGSAAHVEAAAAGPVAAAARAVPTRVISAAAAKQGAVATERVRLAVFEVVSAVVAWYDEDTSALSVKLKRAGALRRAARVFHLSVSAVLF